MGMKPLIIIQARLNSSRLFKKVLKPLFNQPMLFYLIERLQPLKELCTLIVATTNQPIDEAIVAYCKEMNVSVFCGSEENVLERFYYAALSHQGDPLVRITADCPLVDAHLIKKMLTFYMLRYPKYDYVSNTLVRTYPKGLDVEIFSLEALSKAYKLANTPYEKEHVTPYIYNHPDQFSLYNFKDIDNFSNLNVSVDTLQDFESVEKIIQKYYPTNPSFGLKEIKEYATNLSRTD